jgi:hypothetical protein
LPKLLPAVHRVSSLCKRWLLGTHQGRVDPAHLPAYLNEFTFRFNRRHSRNCRLVFYRVLELAAGHDPVRYDDILAVRKPRKLPPLRRGAEHPPSLDHPAASRPWRTAEMQLQLPLRLTAYPGGGNRTLLRRNADLQPRMLGAAVTDQLSLYLRSALDALLPGTHDY